MDLRVFAPDSVVVARPPSPVRTLGSRYIGGAGPALHNGLDMVSGMSLALPHQRAVICSAGVAAEKSRRLMVRGGIEVSKDLRPYRSGPEAVELAKDAVQRGELLEYQFPPYDPILTEAVCRVPPTLLRELNRKTCLETLIASEHLARRMVGTAAQVRRAVADDPRPMVIKPAGDEVNSGVAIFTRRLQERLHRGLFAEMEKVSELWVAEEEIDFGTIWGLQFAATSDGSVHYLGGSVHLPQPTATWVGCVLDDEQPPPELVEAVAAGVRRAAAMGYRGYCSFDAGVGRAGELRVIDPNFRVSGASVAVVQRAARMEQHPCVMAAFWSLPPGRDAEARLAPLIDGGQLLVLIHYDPAETANPPHPATIYGLVGATSRDACGVLVARVQRILAA